MRIIIDEWKKYADETTGKQVKDWLLYNGNLYLYKEASIRKEDNSKVFNDVSECIVSDIAGLIKVPCAEYYLCKRNGQDGVVTPSFLKNKVGQNKVEEFTSGVSLISRIDPSFKNTWLENPQTKDLYTVSLVLKALGEYRLVKQGLEMIVFHLLVGNYDGNPSNWGIITNSKDKSIRFAPLYDNSTSLGISLSDNRLNKYLNPKLGFYVNGLEVIIHDHIISKIVLEKHFQTDYRRIWYQTRKEQNLPNVAYNFKIMPYKPIFEYITTFYPNDIEDLMTRIKLYISEQNMDAILEKYSTEIDDKRLMLAKQMVLSRANWMVNYYEKEKENSKGRMIL